MPCGYCGAPKRTVRQCSCVRARRSVAANLKAGAAKHPNPPLIPPPPPPSPRRGQAEPPRELGLQDRGARVVGARDHD